MGQRGVPCVRGVSHTGPDGAPPCPPPAGAAHLAWLAGVGRAAVAGSPSDRVPGAGHAPPEPAPLTPRLQGTPRCPIARAVPSPVTECNKQSYPGPERHQSGTTTPYPNEEEPERHQYRKTTS